MSTGGVKDALFGPPNSVALLGFRRDDGTRYNVSQPTLPIKLGRISGFYDYESFARSHASACLSICDHARMCARST